ncbi:MAG TPA: alpha/beta hydrolase [Gammaproteobacteria bacterium]|nr:alpha/beta hydrolase [Gammaproteobacteria bacterium]
MGGIITLEMYREVPERFLVALLLGTTTAAAPIPEKYPWNGLAKQARVESVASLLPLFVDDELSGTARLNNPGLIKFVISIVKETSVNAAAAGGYALANRRDYTSILGQISFPVPIAEGVEDTVYPIPVAQQLKQTIPIARLALIRSASHLSFLERSMLADRTIEQ